MKHKYDEAFNVMMALAGATENETNEVMQEFNEINQSITLEQSPDTKRNTRPCFRLVLGVGVQAMQQLTGINVICYYLPYVLTESVGLAPSMGRLLAAVNAMSFLGSTFIGLFLIERWGRRRLMMFGALGQCCCWLTITVLLSQAARSDMLTSIQHQLTAAAVFFFFLFNCFFGAGWQGVSWLYPTEINSTKYRIKGMSYGVATNWLINFTVVFITPLGIAKLGPQFYIIWTALNALMVPIIWIFYPETAGRSLEDIDRMFEAHPTIWVFTHLSMVSRKPSQSLTSGSTEHIHSVELSDLPESYGVENATIAERPLSYPFQVDIGSASHVRHRQTEGHPTSLVDNSLTPESTRKDGDDLSHSTTMVSTQTGQSLGPQVSATALL